MIYYTTTAIMQKTGKSRDTVTRWINSGEMDAIETAAGRMVSHESWKKFVENHPKYWCEPDVDEKTDIRAIYYQLYEVQRYINELLPQIKRLLQ